MEIVNKRMEMVRYICKYVYVFLFTFSPVYVTFKNVYMYISAVKYKGIERSTV